MNPTTCKSCGLPIFHGPAGYAGPQCMCRWTNAAPRQPEGDAISRERVQAEADAFFDWPTADKSSVTTTSCLIFARCIAGMVAAERDATIERLESGIPRIQEQSHQMRQQLAERDAEIMEQCRLNGMGAERELKLLTQRDKLAGLLRDVRVIVAREVERWTRAAAILPVNASVESGLLTRIDAALDEVKP